MEEQTYKWTVWCNTNNGLTRHFADKNPAVVYVNRLLRRKERAVLRPYKQSKNYIDYVAARGENG